MTMVIAIFSATATRVEPNACRNAGSVSTFGIARMTPVGFAT